MFKLTHKVIHVALIAAFVVSSLSIPSSHAVEEWGMPAPGTMVSLSPVYTPALLKGMVIHPENALKFDFLVHKGSSNLDKTQEMAEYNKLIKYFLAALTVPDKDQWVNLSPYEKNRMIEGDLGKTVMGRDLLAQDYLLKQITSSLMYPKSGLGKIFWDKVYAQAYQQFGTTNIPVDTFNKVWIVPDQAVFYESGNVVYVAKSHLKVMLEEDYLSLYKHNTSPSLAGLSGTGGQDKAHNLASKVIRAVILPALEKEVNEGKNFAMLRQVFSSMLLATWYKKALKDSLLGKIFVDQGKVQGVNQDPKNNDTIYQQYVVAFKKGVYNYIKEDEDKYTNQTVPRKYFSGGFKNDAALVAQREQPSSNTFLDVLGQQHFSQEGAIVPVQLTAEGLNVGNAAMTSSKLAATILGTALCVGSGCTGISVDERSLSTQINRDVYTLDVGESGIKDSVPMDTYGIEELSKLGAKLNNRGFRYGALATLGNPPGNFIVSPSLGINTSAVEIITPGNPRGIVLSYIGPAPLKGMTPEQYVGLGLYHFPEGLEIATEIVNSAKSGNGTGTIYWANPALKETKVDGNGDIKFSFTLPGGETYVLVESVNSSTFRAFYRVQEGVQLRIADAQTVDQELRPNRGAPPKVSMEMARIRNLFDLVTGIVPIPGEVGKYLVEVGDYMEPDSKRILLYDVTGTQYNPVTDVTGQAAQLFPAAYAELMGNHNLAKAPAVVIPGGEPKEGIQGAQSENGRTNSAMLTRPGGIDFNTANFAMIVNHDGKGMSIPLTPQDMAQFKQISGFSAMILGIKSAAGLPFLNHG